MLKPGLLALIPLAPTTTAALADCQIVGDRFGLSQSQSVSTTGVHAKAATSLSED